MMTQPKTPKKCQYLRPLGWWCRRAYRHTGPCALERRWWNILGL